MMTMMRLQQLLETVLLVTALLAATTSVCGKDLFEPADEFLRVLPDAVVSSLLLVVASQAAPLTTLLAAATTNVTTTEKASGTDGGCPDVPPDTKYSCAQQKAWGKCGDSWMEGHCLYYYLSSITKGWS